MTGITMRTGFTQRFLRGARQNALLLAGALGLTALAVVLATPFMAVSTLAWGLLTIGLFNRRNRQVHVTLMISSIILDFAVVLILEVQRQAINTALSFTLSPLQQAHIAASSVATVLYFPVVVLGGMRLQNKLSPAGNLWHKRLGIAAYTFRTLGFLLMFALLARR